MTKKIRVINLEGYGEVLVYKMPLLMRPFAIACVINKKIRCSASAPSQRMLRHELIHKIQQEEMGWWKFLFTYIWLWFKSGLSYYHHPMEKDAREFEKTPEFKRQPFNWKYL